MSRQHIPETPPMLQRSHYYFVGAMLLLTLAIEIGGRLAEEWDFISGPQRESIGLILFVPLSMALMALHRVIQEARVAKALTITALALLFVAQLADFRTAVIIPTGRNVVKAPLPILDDLAYAAGSICLVAACYFALLQLETGRLELRRKRARLEAESRERERAQVELQHAHAELEQRVKERTAEIAEKNRQLAIQLVEGERIRQELERSQDLLHEMERITRCGAWEIEAGTETIRPTEECRKILGIAPDAPLTTQDALALFPKHLHPTISKLRRDAQDRGAPWDVEAPLTTADGKRRWVRSIGKPEPGPDGKVTQLRGTVQDITERKRAEMALQESENLLHAVISSAPLILWVIDTSGKITLSTGLGLTRLGLAPGMNIGKCIFDMYAEDTAVARLARRALTGVTCSDMLEVNGVVLQASYSPLYDEQGELVGAIGVALDVTQERLYESRMRQQQKMEAIGALAGGIAHDFNNILYAMDGFAALAAKMVKDNESATQCIVELRTAAARARELVDRILTFSRKEPAKREVVNLLKEARDTARLVEPSLPPDVRLQMELDPTTPMIHADPGQMQQVLLNLCTNARDAMRNGGGTLGLKLGRRTISENQAAELGGIEPGAYAECTVSDTGCGMEKYIESRLFEPFFTTKPVGEGTGLGLAIVHNLVQAHGGVIFVESAPGTGTRFRVLLPAGETAEGQATSEGTGTPASADFDPAKVGPPRRVAVVDDEPQVRIFLRMLLEDAGHTVMCYRHGEEALATLLAAAHPPDVVLADLIMPGLSGVELITGLREKYPRLPMVLCSGHVEAAMSPEVRAVEAAAFVKKPIDPEALLALLAEVTAQQAEAVMP